jgi:hypothetical protein
MINNIIYIFYDTFYKIISENETLYRFWLNYYVSNGKKNKKKLPAETDHYYFDGYPRSGNTYTKVLLHYAFKELKGTSHLHSTVAINVALKCQIPIFIIIRNPFDAVASNMYRKVENNSMLTRDRLADFLLKKYIRYYTHVDDNLNNINVVNFETLLLNQSKFLEKFSNYFSQYTDENVRENSLSLIEQVNRRMKDREKNKRDGISSLPNESRKQFKINNNNIILNSKYYEQSTNLYKKLIQNDIII